MRFAYFRAWSCRENEQKLWTIQPLGKGCWLSGEGQRTLRRVWYQRQGTMLSPAHRLPHRFFPSFLKAGASARVRAHTHTHTLGRARAQGTLPRPRQAALPPRWARRPGRGTGRGAEPKRKEKKNASDPQDVLPTKVPSLPTENFVPGDLRASPTAKYQPQHRLHQPRPLKRKARVPPSVSPSRSLHPGRFPPATLARLRERPSKTLSGFLERDSAWTRPPPPPAHVSETPQIHL